VPHDRGPDQEASRWKDAPPADALARPRGADRRGRGRHREVLEDPDSSFAQNAGHRSTRRPGQRLLLHAPAAARVGRAEDAAGGAAIDALANFVPTKGAALSSFPTREEGGLKKWPT